MEGNVVEVKDFFEALTDFMEWVGEDDAELEDLRKDGDRWLATFRKVENAAR